MLTKSVIKRWVKVVAVKGLESFFSFNPACVKQSHEERDCLWCDLTWPAADVESA